MALIIEDGTIVANANSYVTVAEIKAFAAARSLTLPDTDAEIEVLAIKAMDYLSSLEGHFQGYRVSETQTVSFPRSPVYIYGFQIGQTIPINLKNAQSQLAFDWINSDLQSTGDGREVLETGMGPMKKKYAESGSTNSQVNPTAAMAFLASLLRSDSSLTGNVNFGVSR